MAYESKVEMHKMPLKTSSERCGEGTVGGTFQMYSGMWYKLAEVTLSAPNAMRKQSHLEELPILNTNLKGTCFNMDVNK